MASRSLPRDGFLSLCTVFNPLLLGILIRGRISKRSHIQINNSTITISESLRVHEVCRPIVLMHISIHFNQLQILSNWLNSSREFKFSSINLPKTTKTSMFCILFSAQSQVGHWVLSDWESWPRTGDNFIFIAAIWRRTSFGTAVICIDELFHNSTETVNNKHC